MIERQDLFRISVFCQVDDRVELACGRPPLGRAFGSGVVDEDAPHGLGGGGKEVGPIAKGYLPVVADAEICLVNKGSGLKCVPGSLGAEPLLRDGAQGFVHEGQELVRACVVALPGRGRGCCGVIGMG